jgi:hypothetical protein
VTYRKKKHLPTLRKIPNDLWDEINLMLPSEKLDKTVGRPVVPFKKSIRWHSLCFKNWMSVEDVA